MMRATGIVRRIDDLGRVVIPKEIRRNLRLRDGDPLEIYVDREGEVILKKYSPIVELGNFATEYADALSESLQTLVLISDRDAVIAVSGGSKKTYQNKSIGSAVEKVMEERQTLLINDVKSFPVSEGVSLVESEEESEIFAFCIAPVIPHGDVIGTVMICSKDPKRRLGDLERKLAETAASFLAKQLEQ